MPLPGGPVLVGGGLLAGEPLHFEPSPEGAFHALAAVPLGGAARAVATVVLHDAAGRIGVAVAPLPVARRSVPRERIRPPARFTRPPDPELAARIARERDQVRAVFERSHGTPRLWTGEFARPLAGRITSVFGTRRVIVGGSTSRHWGVDLDGRVGTPVRASNRAVVALVGDFYYSGLTVYLDHGAGLVSGYLHLSRILVSPGDTVATGQVIGHVGATGRVTGPHLHWLAHYGRIAVDPLSLLELPGP
ncbi:MAG TPA: M23 family metallopeptidase [Gemmatimonadales bacterium]|nr:M23 family metallopeptidase [Gemmatimonadales bacterium]